MRGSTMKEGARPVFVVHGGVGGPEDDADACFEAVARAHECVEAGGDLLEAVIRAAEVMEDDPRFNAGTGSNFRLDGQTIEMDAALAHSDGRYGAVGCIREVRHPIRVAAMVLETPHTLLVGPGATAYARRRGCPPYDPSTPRARERWKKVAAALKENAGIQASAQGDFDVPAHWNFSVSLEEILGPSDTIGVVGWDGRDAFAAAGSTGGTAVMLQGRVGDTPLLGAGLYAGPHGAVVATGHGETLTKGLAARQVYERLQAGAEPSDACESVMSILPTEVPIGLIALGRSGRWSAHANRSIALGYSRLS